MVHLGSGSKEVTFVVWWESTLREEFEDAVVAVEGIEVLAVDSRKFFELLSC